MAIADRVYDLRQRPTFELRINGVLILPDNPTSLDGRPAVYSLRGGEHHEEESRVATPPWMEIEVSRIPSWMRRGMPVTLDAGYDGEHVRWFTGGIWALGEEDPDYLKTQVIGTGSTDADGVRIERTASLIGGPAIWPPIPSGQYIDTGVDNHLAHTAAKLEEIVARELTRKARIPKRPNDSKVRQVIRCVGDLKGALRDFKIPARDLSGDTVQASIEGILTDSGIASHNISVGAFTLASAGATLDRMPGAGMLTPLLQLQGAFVRQLPSGLVIGRVLDERPAPTAAFTYSTTDQQYARIISADPPLLRVPFNPLIQIWMTLALELDYLGIDGRYFVVGHDWEIGPRGAWSYLDTRGGDDFGGSVGINPAASFTYAIARQVIGSAVYIVATFTDTSIDPDGTLANWAWSDNQTTTPEITTFNGERVATVRIAESALSGDWNVTLTVTDNDGLTGAHTETIDVGAASSAVTIPPFYVAAGTRRMSTPDGGETFNDTTPASKTATAVGARLPDGVNSGQAVFGHSDGSLDRTLDFNLTIANVLAAVGSQFNDVVWDWRVQGLVWALTDNCKLYLSNDYGATFALLADLRTVTYGGFGGTTPAALGNQIGLPAGGGVYIFGGTGAGVPLIAFNSNPFAPGNQWIRQTFTGHLLTDIATPADNGMRIAQLVAPGYGGATMILNFTTAGVGTLVGIYHTNDPPGPSASYSRATGLTAGLKDGRVIMESGPLSTIARIALFGDRDVWRSTDGIAYTEVNDALPAGFTPNHGLFGSSVLTPLAAVYEHLLAVEDSTGTGGVMKSTDEGETWNFIRGPSTLVSWVAGAKAKKISVGAPIATTPAGSITPVIVRNNGGATTWDIQFLVNGSWQTVALPSQIVQSRPRVTCISSTLWFVHDVSGSPSNDHSAGICARTADGGFTWGNSAIGDESLSDTGSGPIGGISHVARAANGWLWGCRQTGNTNADPIRIDILYSEDDGATWTFVDELAAPISSRRHAARIACHPTNAEIVALLGFNDDEADRALVRVTNDALNGASSSWVTNDAGAPGSNNFAIDDGSAQVGINFLIMPNGRFIVILAPALLGEEDSQFWISDTQGTSWVLKQTQSEGTGEDDNWVILAGAGLTKIVAFRVSANAANIQAMVSLDQGETFAAVGSPFPFSNSDNDWSAKYHALADTLVVYAGNNSNATWRIGAFSPVSDAGVWTDLTFNLGHPGHWDSLAVA